MDSLDARRSGAMFLDSAKWFMFDHRNVRRDTDISAWTRRLPLLQRWCLDTMRDMFAFDMPIVRHAEEIGYLRRILCLCGISMSRPSFVGLTFAASRMRSTGST